jgi:hypothetical protein
MINHDFGEPLSTTRHFIDQCRQDYKQYQACERLVSSFGDNFVAINLVPQNLLALQEDI